MNAMMNPMQTMLFNMAQQTMEKVMHRHVRPAQYEAKSEPMDKERFRELMAEYWREVVEEEEKPSEEMVTGFCVLMKAILPQCMEDMKSERPHCGEAAYKHHHRAYKSAIDKLRRATGQDRLKMIPEMFPGIVNGSREHKVLLEKLKHPSTEARATQLGMSKEEYCEAAESLEKLYHD